jgi:hypothetical protein
VQAESSVPASDREHAKKVTKRQWQKDKELSVALPGDQLGEDASDGEEEYVPDEEDIEFDGEEPYTLAAGMIRVASQMVDEAWPELSKYP